MPSRRWVAIRSYGSTWRRRTKRRCKLVQRRFGIAHEADADWIDFPNFLRINVDLNQLGWRNRERVVRIPRTAIGLAECGPYREDHIGGARQAIGDTCPPDAGHPDRQGVILREHAFSH